MNFSDANGTNIGSWVGLSDYDYGAADSIFLGRQLVPTTNKAVGLELTRVGLLEFTTPNSWSTQFFENYVQNDFSTWVFLACGNSQLEDILPLVQFT